MFRHGWKVPLVLLTAASSFTLTIAIPGCNNQPSFGKPDTKTPETGTGGRTHGVPREAVTTQGTLDGVTRQDKWQETAVDIGHGVRLEMVLIAAGEFMMGSPESDGHARGDEKPQHRVRITKPFYLGKYPVTQEQWNEVMANNPSIADGLQNPVDSVSWEDCQKFCDVLNTKPHPEGKFKLPTEAQWEYACRAGNTTTYSFGNDESELSAHAWYFENSHRQSHPVGGKMPNAWGLYDMHGNVCEWCQDWYDCGYYAHSSTDDPAGPVTGSERAFRGGSWDLPARMCRSACRSDGDPACHNYLLGMRVCLAPADK